MMSSVEMIEVSVNGYEATVNDYMNMGYNQEAAEQMATNVIAYS